MPLRHLLLRTSLLAVAALLTGCSTSLAPTFTPPNKTASLGPIMGSVHGGQQPVGGAHVYMLAVGTGGYGTASSSLLLPGLATTADGTGKYYVTADANGNFSVTGDYVCVAGTQVYAYAAGGNPGTGNNAAIGLLAALGQCPSTGTLALQVPFVVINEVSTVVTAYALSGFATDATHIASSGTPLAATGVANAMATALNLINVPSGQVPSVSVAGNAALPVATIYTLANILASCVNSAGPASSNCQTLLGNTSASADTAGAAIAMAHAPFTNVGALFGLASSSPPFQPSLSTAPADLTVSLQYQTPLYLQNLTAPDATYAQVISTAIDSGGNVWTYATNDQATSPDTTATFVKYSSTGAALATTVLPFPGGHAFNAEFDVIAIDSSDNVWAGAGTGEFEISSQGTLLSPAAGYQCNGFNGDAYTAFSADQVYIGVLYGSSIGVLSKSGDCLGSLTAPGISAPDFFGSLSVDSQGNLFSAGDPQNQPSVFEFAGGGNASSNFAAAADRVAVDAQGNIWTYIIGDNRVNGTLHYGEILAKYTAGGTLLSPAYGYSGGGITPLTAGAEFEDYAGPSPVLDGADSVWMISESQIANGYALYVPIIGLKNDGTPITPAAGLISPADSRYLYSVALDGSGNLWAIPGDGSLIEFVGLTTPVATPILYNQLGKRP